MHADIKTRDSDRPAHDAAPADCGQGEGCRQADRDSVASASDARGQGGTDISLDWLDEQIQALTRPDDRALFGLDREPSADADEAEPSAARPAPPITARQKKLLARLVDEHPEFAREFGVDPDEPELETLDKAKAASLIEAMLDRLNAQAPPDER